MPKAITSIPEAELPDDPLAHVAEQPHLADLNAALQRLDAAIGRVRGADHGESSEEAGADPLIALGERWKALRADADLIDDYAEGLFEANGPARVYAAAEAAAEMAMGRVSLVAEEIASQQATSLAGVLVQLALALDCIDDPERGHGPILKTAMDGLRHISESA